MVFTYFIFDCWKNSISGNLLQDNKRHVYSVKCSTNVKLFQDNFIMDIILF